MAVINKGTRWKAPMACHDLPSSLAAPTLVAKPGRPSFEERAGFPPSPTPPPGGATQELKERRFTSDHPEESR